jgi:hypothetical protein
MEFRFVFHDDLDILEVIAEGKAGIGDYERIVQGILNHIARMWQTFLEDYLKLVPMVFRTREDAILWLKETPSDRI